MRQTAKARRRAWRVATARTWIAQRAALARVRLSEPGPTRCRGRPRRVSAVARPDAREAFRHRQRVVARHAMAPLVSVPPSAAASLPCMWPGGLPPTSQHRFACPSLSESSGAHPNQPAALRQRAPRGHPPQAGRWV